MAEAILYARLACADQSSACDLNAQVRTLEAYAESQGFTIAKTIAHVGMPPTQQLGLLMDYLCQHAVRIVIVSRPDRLYRNLKDFVELHNFIEELHLDIHFTQSQEILSAGSATSPKTQE